MLRFQHSQGPLARVWTLSKIAALRDLLRMLRFQHSPDPLARVSKIAVPRDEERVCVCVCHQFGVLR